MGAGNGHRLSEGGLLEEGQDVKFAEIKKKVNQDVGGERFCE